MIGIYKITSPNNRIYIGQSIDIQKRFNNYRSGCYKQPRLHNSIIKYGYEKHYFEIIELCLEDELNNRERFWQDYYKVLGENGLNCKLQNTDELKQVLSDEIKKKISIGCKKAMYGKFTNEYRCKLSKATKGIPKSPEHKLKIGNRFNKIILLNINNGIFYDMKEVCITFEIKYGTLYENIKKNGFYSNFIIT